MREKGKKKGGGRGRMEEDEGEGEEGSRKGETRKVKERE